MLEGLAWERPQHQCERTFIRLSDKGNRVGACYGPPRKSKQPAER